MGVGPEKCFLFSWELFRWSHLKKKKKNFIYKANHSTESDNGLKKIRVTDPPEFYRFKRI